MDATRTRSEFNVSARNGILWLCMTALPIAAAIPRSAQADAATEREYQLKAAFLYNFVMFVDSPRFASSGEEAERDASGAKKPILIGIIGKDPFGAAFEPLKNKQLRDRPVVIKRFKGLKTPVDIEAPAEQNLPDLDAIKQCHVLFVCASERAHLGAILGPIRTTNILTVADTPGFLDAGGMINFLIEEKKVRFEINAAAAARTKLEIRSKLLRLAKEVIKTDGVEGQNEDGRDEARAGDK
jgi:hypothetical protein